MLSGKKKKKKKNQDSREMALVTGSVVAVRVGAGGAIWPCPAPAVQGSVHDYLPERAGTRRPHDSNCALRRCDLYPCDVPARAGVGNGG